MSTNNKVIYINTQAMLESEEKTNVFDTMQSLASQSITVKNSDKELQKQYMKLLSDKK